MRVRAVAVAGALASVLAACGTGGVPPQDWARDVCVAVKPWSTQIDASVTQARQQITDAADPTKAKAELIALFSGAQQASADAAGKVRKAGVPDADNGEQVASQFTKALEAARANFGRAADGVEALPTKDRAKFYEGVVKVGDQLSKDNNASSRQLSDVRSKDLEKAFAEVPECR
ncbi:MAG TPA: hypothetical protein VGP02_14775 [Mycobacteriales bacterium]|jgi:hypothetical protein|nr:hypothetical protein [Mycobacteriales bacterium]